MVARIKMLRKQGNFTQAELCQLLDMEQANYSAMENGKQLPTIKQLVKLSVIFNKSLDYLILGKEPKGFTATD